jgi:hypothetical protein
MQDVEEQGFQHGGRVISTVKIETLKAAESEGVLDVVEKQSHVGQRVSTYAAVL